MKTLLLLGIITVFVAGCATAPRPTPLAPVDIISMTKAGVPDEEIIRRIDQSRTVFRLGSEDVIQLRKEGVSERIVNYLLDTYVRYSVYQQRQEDFDNYDWHYRFGFWYGPRWRRW